MKKSTCDASTPDHVLKTLLKKWAIYLFQQCFQTVCHASNIPDDLVQCLNKSKPIDDEMCLFEF